MLWSWWEIPKSTLMMKSTAKDGEISRSIPSPQLGADDETSYWALGDNYALISDWSIIRPMRSLIGQVKLGFPNSGCVTIDTMPYKNTCQRLGRQSLDDISDTLQLWALLLFTETCYSRRLTESIRISQGNILHTLSAI